MQGVPLLERKQAIRSMVATLTSAELLALHTASVVVVPGVAGSLLVPVKLMLDYVFETAAYVDHGGNLRLVSERWAVTWAQFGSAGFWDAAESRFQAYSIGTNSGTIGGTVGDGLMLNQDTANPTGGDGIVVATVFFFVVPVS